MLEVRKHASEAFACMGHLDLNYSSPGCYRIDQWMEALIKAEKDQRRLVQVMRANAERRLKELGELVAALRFVSEATQPPYSSGIAVGGKAMTLQMSEIFKTAIHRIEMVLSSDKGLVEGRQPDNERNFVEEMFAKVPRQQQKAGDQ